MTSRRVSLPVTLTAPRPMYSSVNRLSPPSASTSKWKSHQQPVQMPGRRTHRRSLPGTPRNLSPRYRTLPHLEENASSSRRASSSRLSYSSGSGGFMEANNNVCGKDSSQSIDRIEGQLRSFEYSNGSLVDKGYEFKGLERVLGRKRGENRRATCPEIYLYPASTAPPRQVLLRLYGSRNSGKKTLAHQIYHIASTTTPDQTHVISNATEEAGSKSITFLLNGEEVKLEIVMESALESMPFTDHITMFVVVYSVDSRESFKKATRLLYRIYETRTSPFVPVALVGNKVDLKRNIVVSTLEGKSLAKIYKCSFVEVSALLSMNINTMWAELIKQLHVPSEYKPADRSWMQRLLLRGRHLAKSCEEIVQRIMS
uniref:GTP-binding protein Rheb n=2 Tax=Haemonchus contortus TaxID=6289 RepID=A0A7I4Y9L7_HAECO|nr:Ras domain containing protein [Haemonchus contortus]